MGKYSHNARRETYQTIEGNEEDGQNDEVDGRKIKADSSGKGKGNKNSQHNI